LQAKFWRRKHVPAAWAVMSVAAALLVVLVAAIALLAYNAYSDALDRTRVRVTSSALVVSANVEWLVAASLQALEEADRLVGENPSALPGNFDEELAIHLKHLPYRVSLSIVDAEGRLIHGSAQDGSAQDPKSNAQGLLPHDGIDLSRFPANLGWYVSAMVKDADGSESSFIVVRRLTRGGKLAGAALLRYPVSVMASVWSSLDLGPGSTVGLIRDDGWMVARHPAPDKPVNLSGYVLFTEHLKKGDNGVYDAVSPIDGSTRIVAYRKVPNAPLIVIASTARDFALLRVRQQMESLLLVLVPLMLGLAGLAVWVVRLMRRDEAMRANLAAAVERNTLLMREIHHRIKNNMQSVASLVRLQPISDDAKAAMNARIAAMSAVHEQAYRSDHYADVELDGYLDLLVTNIAKGAGEDIAFVKELHPATIDRDLAQPLGLVVNEVISNAIKHAFGEPGTGTVTITLNLIAPERAELTIRDDGVGFDPLSETGNGMGSRLIRAFAQQLGGDFDYIKDNGTRFAIRFKARAASAP
jgi:two-component system, sensor histidine kinase PdtaS